MLLGSEVAGVVATIDPDAYAASTVVSDWVAMKSYPVVMAIILAGELGSSATLDAKVRQAKDGSGTDAKDITGKSIVQLTQAGTDSDKQAIINVREDELDVEGGFGYVAISMTIATATSDAGAVMLGFNPTYGFADDNDLASVDEIVN